ncbi:hypothetical protein [Spirosoma spitsbergense]|nr:hypothetical protein [Spirosoma spitsbergense]
MRTFTPAVPLLTLYDDGSGICPTNQSKTDYALRLYRHSRSSAFAI